MLTVKDRLTGCCTKHKIALNRSHHLIDDEGKASRRPEKAVTGSKAGSFTPLFTMVEDGMTGEQHHPHVHYVFSDDDPDIITNAALRALNADADISDVREGSDELVKPVLRGERSIIVDMSEDGQMVADARSLCPEWQVFEHSLTLAPSFSDADSASRDTLMLRIAGKGASSPKLGKDEDVKASSNDQRSEQQLLDRLDALSQQFNKGLETLKKLSQIPTPGPSKPASDPA